MAEAKKVYNQKEIMKVLQGTSSIELFESVRKKAISDSDDIPSVIKSIFYGSPPVNEECLNYRFETFKFVINLIQASTISSSIAADLVAILIQEVDAFPTSYLMKIAEFTLDEVKEHDSGNVSWLEIFPKILSSISLRDTIVYKNLEASGLMLKTEIIKQLCKNKISPSCAVQLTSVFKDVDLSNEEMDLMVAKLLRILPTVDYQTVPSFIYQFLLLSSKNPKKQILQGILSYFMTEDKKMQEKQDLDTESEPIDMHELQQLRQIEGTVILLIEVSARQDKSIGKEFLSLLKTVQHKPEIVFAPFMFSVALSLVKVHRYEDQILELLKNVVQRCYKLKSKLNHSVWMRELVSCNENIMTFVKETIKMSKHGWDSICPGLLKFGFVILDSFGPKPVCGRLQNFSKPHIATVSEQACSLGSVLLKDTFKTHRTARSEVFEQILNRIITKSMNPVSHYINVLSQTVQGDPQLLLEVLSKLIEILDYLPFLPHANALGILQALSPLLKISMPLKDTLMLVLRKALFHVDMEARKVAISGYLTILKKISAVGKVSLSQSQSSVSSQASVSSNYSQKLNDSMSGSERSKSVCLEIMGILKRALMQQAEVRQLLYEGLYDVASKNVALLSIVLELLLFQFEKLYNSTDDHSPPIDLTLCVLKQKDKLVINEPVAHLITSIYLILHEAKSQVNEDDFDDDDGEQSSKLMLENILSTLSKKMARTDIEEFNVKDEGEENSGSGNKQTVLLLMQVYEALMEYLMISCENYNNESCKDVLSLFQKYKELSKMLQEKKSNKSGKNKAVNLSTPNSHLTFKFFSVSINLLFENDNPRFTEGLNVLRCDAEYVRHVLTVCNQKLVTYCETGKTDGFSENMQHLHEYFFSVGRIFLKCYSDGLIEHFQSLEKHELSLFFIEGLNHLFHIMFLHGGKNADKFILELGQYGSCSSEDVCCRVTKTFKKLLIDLLADTRGEVKLKEVVPLLSIIEQLCTLPTNRISSDIYQWIKQLNKEQTFDEVSVAKSLVSLCLTVSHQHNDCVEVLKKISFDIHYHLRDIDPDASIRGTTTFDVVNARTASNLIPTVVFHMEQVLEEIDWVLNIMKADAFAQVDIYQETRHEVLSQRKVDDKEEKVCMHVTKLIFAFSELVQSALPIGYVCNMVLKAVTNLYKMLTTFAKYYILLYQQKSGHLPSGFEKIVKLSGTHLTTPVYALITFIQNAESELKDKKTKKSDAAANKVVREVKTVPSLVFAIELYERHLIILSKKCKKNLMAHIKLSTSRDFRIDSAAIQAVVEQREEEEENLNEVENESDTDAASNINGLDSSPAEKSSSPPHTSTSSKRKKAETTLSKKKRK